MMETKSHTTTIMHLLLWIMILGICWLILVELKSGDPLTITDLLGWLIIIFIIPLTLMNFHDELPWFTGGSMLFALVYSILALAQVISLPERSCCQVIGFVILIATMITCLVIMVLGLRDLLRFRRKSYKI